VELVTPHPFRSADAKDEYLDLYDSHSRLWPVDTESRTVYTAYGQTFVRISGPATAPPLVLLPGYGAHSLMWIPNIKPLSEHFQTFAVDSICDVGRSVGVRPVDRSDDFASWLEGLFNALRLSDSINLVGASFGGWLASQYALFFPARLRKMVLLGPAATVLPLSPGFRMRRLLSGLPITHLRRWLISWLYSNWKNDQTNRELYKVILHDTAVAARCFKQRRTIAQPTVLTAEEWAWIQVPTLYLVGEEEKLCSAVKAVARLNRVAPNVQAEIIPSAGHNLNIVQAEVVNRKLLAFLADT
jgi:pimeloyl-ACP methyl ester carboxylesterase